MICETFAVISLSLRTMTLCETGKTYTIGIGAPGSPTPTGDFVVQYKELDPVWEHPITNEVMGQGYFSHWIALGILNPEAPEHLQNEFGLHPSNSGVGAAHSLGCLRMFPQDVPELYEEIEPLVDTIRIVN